MAGFGTTALLITLLIAALVIVPGVLAARGGTLGRVFRDFDGKHGVNAPERLSATPAPPLPSHASPGRFCTECGAGLDAAAAFCTQCGTRV